MSKRQEMRDKRARAQRNQRIMLIVGVAVVGVAIALALILPNLQPVGEIVMPEFPDRGQTTFNTMGDPNAPVKIIEYSDFQCPYCGNFSKDTEPQIVENYVKTGKVYFEYRSVGQFIGVESARAAEAAYCAGDQGKFWEMHDVIFANQTGENVGAYSDRRLIAFAENLDLDMTSFKDCFNNGKYESRLRDDEKNAQLDIPAATNFAELVAAGQYSAQGISTPTFLVNGKMVAGAQPFSVFQQEIEAALAAAGQ